MSRRVSCWFTTALLAAGQTLWLAGAVPGGLLASVRAAEVETEAIADELSFLRITRSSEGEPRSLDTAIVRYEGEKASSGGLAVDLVAAVHIGSEQYYTTLNRLFRDYDVVLYELVAPENNRIPRAA